MRGYSCFLGSPKSNLGIRIINLFAVKWYGESEFVSNYSKVLKIPLIASSGSQWAKSS